MIWQIKISTEQDIVAARYEAKKAAQRLDFSLADQTRVATATSELARNIFLYAEMGTVAGRNVTGADGRSGIEVIFSDEGPGIADVKLAMNPGFSTGGGLGLGLSGTQRLVDEFEINSKPGIGTIIRILKWK